MYTHLGPGFGVKEGPGGLDRGTLHPSDRREEDGVAGGPRAPGIAQHGRLYGSESSELICVVLRNGLPVAVLTG
jgi:hypothetical protein